MDIITSVLQKMKLRPLISLCDLGHTNLCVSNNMAQISKTRELITECFHHLMAYQKHMRNPIRIISDIEKYSQQIAR